MGARDEGASETRECRQWFTDRMEDRSTFAHALANSPDEPGKCPQCGMDLLPEGTRFAMLRHMIKNPMMLAIMAALMVAIMATVMMMTR